MIWEHYVIRFNVSMDDAFLVERKEASENLFENMYCLVLWLYFISPQFRKQCASFHILEYEVKGWCGLNDLFQLDDVRTCISSQNSDFIKYWDHLLLQNF